MIERLNYEDKIIEDIYISYTFIDRLIGYMFREKPHYQAIAFIPCNSIHTFFMKFNIDVIFINDYMEVVKVVKCVKPWKIIPPVKGATGVIEVPSTN